MIRKAITRPCRQIMDNAGEEGSVIVGHLLEKYGSEFNMGYDAAQGEYVDMIKKGILDPLKVVRTALVDASGYVPVVFFRGWEEERKGEDRKPEIADRLVFVAGRCDR